MCVRRLLGPGLVLIVLLAMGLELSQAATSPRFVSSVRPLSDAQRAQLDRVAWNPGCPVALSDVRLVSFSHVDFDGETEIGQLVVNRDVARPLVGVFRKLYALGFPIRHARFADLYGPKRLWPKDGDVSGSFWCRQAVPSPCTGGNGTGSWSNHAYGFAIDLNPVENPYVGCGMSRNPKARSYMDRSRVRPGMVTPAVVRAFASIGWGWGGAWTGDTKDYMHFSVNGH
jgi:D-alanyl-D-alanine carboxypeptidase